MIKMKYLCKYLIASILLGFQTQSHAQLLVSCENGNCNSTEFSSYFNRPGYTAFEMLGVDDDVSITTTSTESPRDFRTYVTTESATGEDVIIDVKSLKENAPAANFVLIGDSLKSLTINADGFDGSVYLDASKLCAKNINDGVYSSTIRTRFLQRRSLNPLIPMDTCDSTDLALIQTHGGVTCDAGQTPLASTSITGTRWKPKRECETNAGRAMCVNKRISLRCDSYADRTAWGCCSSAPNAATTLLPNQIGGPPTTPTAGLPVWQCNNLKCSATDSGWFRRYTFRMEEYTSEGDGYADMVSKGHSNEYICETKIQGGAIGGGDVFTLINQLYSAATTYHSSPTNFNFTVPADETIVGSEFAAGQCGSFEDSFEPFAASLPIPYTNTEMFSSYSPYIATGTTGTFGETWLRMEGDGYKSHCVGSYTDYAVGSHCYGALQAASIANICVSTEPYNKHKVGNQCWEELLPTCSGIYTNYNIPGGVTALTNPKLFADYNYCREDRIWRNCIGSYTNYPMGSYCHERLKAESCVGDYTDYQPGSTCWFANQPACPGIQGNYTAGTFCWQKLSPLCNTSLDSDDGDGIDPTAEQLYCDSYLASYPPNLPCAGNYTDYPVGSQCWHDRQPVCAGLYTSYPNNSFCYNKLKPTCTGNYYDYPTNSACYELLKPQVCVGSFDDYTDGSFCHTTSRPTCAGSYTGYPVGSYCYNKLAPVCAGTYTDYPVGSYCYMKISPGVCPTGTNYSTFPAGSFCWQALQPECSGAHTDYPFGSYCYNDLYPGQDPEFYVAPGNDANCAIITGEGSLCWRNAFGECEREVTDPEWPQGTYCARKENAAKNGYCEDEYSDYPRLSHCWLSRRTLPDPFEYIPNGCSVKCELSSGVSCNLATPVNYTPHELTDSSLFVGQRVRKDGFASFKVKIKTINSSGLEKARETEVRIRVRASP